MNSLCSEIWLGTDLDLFLVGGPPASNTQTPEKIYDAFRAHALGSGKFKTVLATRTRASVTFFSSADEDRRPPPLQVILHVYGSVEELLARFDVDCCACAYGLSSGKFVWTERCRRSFCYGANIVQSNADSASYAHRLEKYATRYGFRVAVPGLQVRHLKRELLDGSYIFVSDLDLMLRVTNAERRVGECVVSFGGRRESISYTAKISTTLVSDTQRLFLRGCAQPLKISHVCTPRPVPCELCQTVGIDEDSLSEAVVVSPTGAPGDFDVFAGPSLGEHVDSDFVCCGILGGSRRPCPNGIDNMAGYSCTPIARAMDVFENCLKHHLVANDATKWLDGGAVGKIGRLMGTQNGECCADFCQKRFGATVLKGGPLWSTPHASPNRLTALVLVR